MKIYQNRKILKLLKTLLETKRFSCLFNDFLITSSEYLENSYKYIITCKSYCASITIEILQWEYINNNLTVVSVTRSSEGHISQFTSENLNKISNYFETLLEVLYNE